jgi:hypothetical protein
MTMMERATIPALLTPRANVVAHAKRVRGSNMPSRNKFRRADVLVAVEGRGLLAGIIFSWLSNRSHKNFIVRA